MLNSETKRRIDAARDVLVGVAPNPMTQIDQITYALIYKFMDDMDEASIRAGGEPSFFVGELAPFAWSKLMDSRIGNHEKLELYGEALQKFAEAKQLPELFRTIFRSAFLPYRSSETLGLFLKEISFFDYSHSEELGNAYEYLLSIMSAQGDAGQFRTPRHIIDFMVQVIGPTKDDKILDPACGTGGFLVSSYKHILQQHDGQNDPEGSEKPLTPDDRMKLMKNFEGYDIDPSMVRMARVNMYLHQFKSPSIFQYDSLTSEDRWEDKFDVILANPPFMTPKGGIRPHKKFSLQSQRSELLFLDFITGHLRPGGRAAVVVPEGVVYNPSNTYQAARQRALEAGLFAVVSLPSGVFLPYSGVKTSVLFFDKRTAAFGGVLLRQTSAVGVSLNAARTSTKANDLVSAHEEISRFLAGDSTLTSHSEMLMVSKKDVAAAGFDLSFQTYKSPHEDGVARVRLDQLCKIRKGKSSSTKTETGPYPLYVTAEDAKSSKDFDFEGSGVAVPLISARGHGRAEVKRVHLVEGKFALANLLAFVEPKDEKVLNAKFLHYILSGSLNELANLMRGAANVGMSLGDLSGFKIPQPPITEQLQIVEELGGLESIIEETQKALSTRRSELLREYLTQAQN